MKKPISVIQTRALNMIYADAERDRAFDAYTQMYHNGWTLPEAVKRLPWVRKVISSDPHDSVETGVRILSTLPVTLAYQALGPGPGKKERANMVETVLQWELMASNRRRSKSLVSDVVRSALVYDAVAIQVIDLDYQIAQKQFVNADNAREKLARQTSRFLIQPYSPRNVHARYSTLGVEAVLLVQDEHAASALDDWGDLARQYPGLLALSETPIDDWVTRYDYWDYNQRLVWLVPGRMGNAGLAQDESMILVDEANEIGFIPWVALMGGSVIESQPEHQYMPLLYSVYTSGAWDVQNIVKTLAVSETIARSGSPRYADEGPTNQTAVINYFSPERIAKMPPGHTLKQLSPPEFDQALATVDAMMAAQIDKATVNRILQGGDLPAGLAFATLNLATQTSLGALKPAKDLSETAVAAACALMLMWSHFTENSISAYATDKSQEEYGEEMVIDHATIDPQAIYLTAELHPDAPTDRQQRVNTAALAVERLDYPIERALEDIGVNDPQTAIKTRIKERFLDHLMQMMMQKDIMEMQANFQMQMAQAQAQMQMQAQAQMPGGEVPPGAEGMQEPGPGGALPGGQANNPAEEGLPPAMFNPTQTREMISGTDFLGNQVQQ